MVDLSEFQESMETIGSLNWSKALILLCQNRLQPSSNASSKPEILAGYKAQCHGALPVSLSTISFVLHDKLTADLPLLKPTSMLLPEGV